MPQMLFPDNRFKSPTSYSGFGLSYACDDVRAAQQELKLLLDEAKATKLLTTHTFTANEGHPIAVNAQAVFDQAVNENLVIFSDSACADWTARLQDASAKLRDLLLYYKTNEPSYEPPGDSPYTDDDGDKPDTLDKLKPLFIAGAVAIGAIVLAPILFEVAGFSKMFRKTRRRTAGYGRLR